MRLLDGGAADPSAEGPEAGKRIVKAEGGGASFDAGVVVLLMRLRSEASTMRVLRIRRSSKGKEAGSLTSDAVVGSALRAD